MVGSSSSVSPGDVEEKDTWGMAFSSALIASCTFIEGQSCGKRSGEGSEFWLELFISTLLEAQLSTLILARSLSHLAAPRIASAPEDASVNAPNMAFPSLR